MSAGGESKTISSVAAVLIYITTVIPLDPQAHIRRNNMKQTPLVSYNVLCFVLHPVLKLILKTSLRSRQSVATVSFHR